MITRSMITRYHDNYYYQLIIQYTYVVIVHIISDWASVARNVYIDYDLEEHPLQIKTDSAVGSDEEVWVQFYTAEWTWFSGISLSFSITPRYYIWYCTSSDTTFPVDLPAELDKIWTITKTATALVIECNDVEVLNYLYSEASMASCVTTLSQDVEKIWFTSINDDASDAYRQKPTGV